jgi:hypothetical protein
MKRGITTAKAMGVGGGISLPGGGGPAPINWAFLYDSTLEITTTGDDVDVWGDTITTDELLQDGIPPQYTGSINSQTALLFTSGALMFVEATTTPLNNNTGNPFTMVFTIKMPTAIGDYSIGGGFGTGNFGLYTNVTAGGGNVRFGFGNSSNNWTWTTTARFTGTLVVQIHFDGTETDGSITINVNDSFEATSLVKTGFTSWRDMESNDLLVGFEDIAESDFTGGEMRFFAAAQQNLSSRSTELYEMFGPDPINWAFLYDSTLEVTTSGSDVTNWGDSAGSSSDLTGGSKPPQYTGFINGESAIKFESGDFLIANPVSNLSTELPISIFITCKFPSIDGDYISYSHDLSGSTLRIKMNVSSGNSNITFFIEDSLNDSWEWTTVNRFSGDAVISVYYNGDNTDEGSINIYVDETNETVNLTKNSPSWADMTFSNLAISNLFGDDFNGGEVRFVAASQENLESRHTELYNLFNT